MTRTRIAKAAAVIAVSLGALLTAPAALAAPADTQPTVVTASFGWGG
ncbi:hypothetical protein ACFWJT_34770 [Streptomyces sp. NPDC127069]